MPNFFPTPAETNTTNGVVGHARAQYPLSNQTRASLTGGFTLIELLIVVSIIGLTVVLSSFSVTVFDDFKVTEKANILLDEITQCREEAIYLGNVCSIHIETAKTKRVINDSLVGRTVTIGGAEYSQPVIPYRYKVEVPDEDTTFDLLAHADTDNFELNLIYPLNVDPTGEKDPLLKQGVVSFYPDGSYTPFILKLNIAKDDITLYLHGDGKALPKTTDESPLLTY